MEKKDSENYFVEVTCWVTQETFHKFSDRAEELGYLVEDYVDQADQVSIYLVDRGNMDSGL